MIRYRNGAYVVSVEVGQDPVTGKRKRVERSLRMLERKRVPDLVKDLEARLRAEVRQGLHGGPKVTVGELLSAWLEHARGDLAATTVHGYERTIRLYLRPALGSTRIDKLTTARLDALYQSLRGRGLSPATIRQAHAIVRRALTQAQRWGWVERNVASLAQPPSVKRKETPTATREQVALLVERANQETALLVALAAGTGCRRGELCGLRWSDVDLEAGGEAVIRHSVFEIAHKVGVKDTKSGRERKIALGPLLVARLRTQRKIQAERALRAGASFTDGYVLSESLDASEPLNPNVASDRFRALAKKCGITLRLHDLRHASVTHALAAGVPVKDVAAHHGHASPRMTLDVYAHAMPSGLRAVAEANDI